jgi:hypothetical protein
LPRCPITTDKPTVDGKLDDWNGASWLTIDERTVQVGDWNKRKAITAAAVRVAGNQLFVAIKTDTPDLLANRGDTLTNLFKTGGAIDLMIGADPSADPRRAEAVEGDQRLLISKVNGKTTAVRYVPVSSRGGEPVLFSSPVRTVKIDLVENVGDRISLESSSELDKKNSVTQAYYELAIPLALLDLHPSNDQTVRADIGVLRGNGFQTLQRVYWSNKSTGLVSDIPSEAELLPRLWGTWNFTDRTTN